MASYMLSYDTVTAATLEYQLLGFIKQNRHITQWYRAFSGCYLLKSTADLNTIIHSFRDFFGFDHQHLVAPIEGLSTGGILPQYMWDWLNQPEPTPLANYLGLLSAHKPPEQ
jgi:hypothetical protein